MTAAFTCDQGFHRWASPINEPLGNSLVEADSACLNPYCTATRTVLFGPVHTIGQPELAAPGAFEVINEVAAGAHLAEADQLPYRQALREKRSPYRRSRRMYTVLLAAQLFAVGDALVGLVTTGLGWVPLWGGLLIIALALVSLFMVSTAAMAERETRLGVHTLVLAKLIRPDTRANSTGKPDSAETPPGPAPALPA
ncbi:MULTISPECIES: hypothetical protein [unclassified Crossiella]|uniref:hypothetical protein n=1 Tax=unclassified Crossiella TaxID=2620835 RepID=UPI0020000FDC|nr:MULTISPECIES: hypothetical protein [unclassified Crossiella]MCK2240080.1 hypothetical protein [Crossiella sp. S99.2]MCK2252789.1 hypothetical protein [Crossiella sp. S99.1]